MRCLGSSTFRRVAPALICANKSAGPAVWDARPTLSGGGPGFFSATPAERHSRTQAGTQAHKHARNIRREGDRGQQTKSKKSLSVGAQEVTRQIHTKNHEGRRATRRKWLTRTKRKRGIG